jgi:hypothetical protein
MAIDLFGPGATLPAGGGVELAGLHQWVRSLLVPPLFFALVAVVCGLSGARDWLVVATVLSVLAIAFEALVLRAGVTSLVVSPVSVVRRDRRRTRTVRAEDVNDIVIRHVMNGPIMVISSGQGRVGLVLPKVYRNPRARDALASFLWRAGADPSLGGLGMPWPARQRPAVAASPRTPAGLAFALREAPRHQLPLHEVPFEEPSARAGTRRPPALRVKGRALTWATFGALALTAAIGVLRLVH